MGRGSAGSAQTSPSDKPSQGAQSSGQSNQAKDQGSQSKDKGNQAQSQSKDQGSQAQSQSGSQHNQSSQAQPGDRGMQSNQRANEQAQGSQGGAGRAGASGSTSTQSTTVGASASNVTLNTEQKTKIRETVINASNAPRASNLSITVNVGTTVPSSVRIVPVPSVLVEVNPQWRGYEYFVYNDEIILVDPRTHRIVAILPA